MRSAIVPCGTSSSVIFPALNNSSKAGGVGRGKLQTSLATRPSANSLGSIGEPKPALFETIVSSRAPCAIKPSSSSCGWPTTPKPPSSTTEPSFTPARASAMLATRLSINQFPRRQCHNLGDYTRLNQQIFSTLASEFNDLSFGDMRVLYYEYTKCTISYSLSSQTPMEHHPMTLMRLRRAAQLTLPADVRRALNVKDGDYLEAQVMKDGVLLRPV